MKTAPKQFDKFQRDDNSPAGIINKFSDFSHGHEVEVIYPNGAIETFFTSELEKNENTWKLSPNRMALRK